MTRTTEFSEHRLPRVLIVDDDESVIKFVGRVLRDAGYEVAAASNGSDALQIAEAQRPFDVFVVDVLMHMRGDELGQRIRQMDAGAKVLYVTGNSDVLFKETVTLWEDSAFVDKPVSSSGLLEAVSLLRFGHTQVYIQRPADSRFDPHRHGRECGSLSCHAQAAQRNDVCRRL